MKNLMLLVFCVMPFWAFGQDVDSVRVAGEVDSLVQVCRGLIRQGKFKDAFKAIEISTKVSDTVFGKESELYAKCIINQGRVFQASGKATEAKQLYLNAIALLAKINRTEQIDYAGCLNNLSIILYDEGKFDEELTLLLELKSLHEKGCFDKKHPLYNILLIL